MTEYTYKCLSGSTRWVSMNPDGIMSTQSDSRCQMEMYERSLGLRSLSQIYLIKILFCECSLERKLTHPFLQRQMKKATGHHTICIKSGYSCLSLKVNV